MRILLVITALIIPLISFSQNEKVILKKYPKALQKIVLTESGAFRGFNFGDKKELIKAKEIEKIESETDTSLIYTIYLDADDSADILYYFDNSNKVKGFATVFILADEAEEKNLKSKFIKYFTEKFGPYKVVREEDELWNSHQGYTIEMRDTSDEAGMEIEILYYKP